MFKNFNFIPKFYFTILIIFIIFISIFFIPFMSNNNDFTTSNPPLINEKIEPTKIGLNNIYWPLPGYTSISSPYGYRGAPTAGATNFHGGIDLPAPPGTSIISAISGKVTWTGFMGSGGCTVVVTNEKYTVIFHHVSPNFLVSVGDYVSQGQVIAQVGPKNVYGFANNPYKDVNRKSYKWCNNRFSSTFYSKNRIKIN